MNRSQVGDRDTQKPPARFEKEPQEPDKFRGLFLLRAIQFRLVEILSIGGSGIWRTKIPERGAEIREEHPPFGHQHVQL